MGKRKLLISASPYSYSMKKFVATLRRSMLLQVLVLVPLTPGLVFLPVQLNANPEGGVVVAGNVNFSGLGTAVLDINNASQHAIINWQNFSIGAGEVTNINQAANAHTLNRVVSSNPTEIYGMLKAANGSVTVINGNGILVGPGGVVDIAGLLTMSTLDVSNNEFLNNGAKRYQGDSSAGIRNYGSITSQSGDVVLLGNFLQNAGSVSAPDGTVAFGAGGDMIVDQAAGGLISVRGGGPGGETGIENTGTINAAGAELKAHGNVYALAIKNDGLVRASGYNFKGGRLTLSGGSNGSIVNNGQLQARNRDGSGGQVEIAGGRVQLAAGSLTDASAEPGRNGGSVNVSGTDVTVGQGALVSVAGASAGSVTIAGANSASVAGSIDAVGDMGRGGKVDVTAEDVVIAATGSVNASGLTGGGAVRIGGGFHGTAPDIANSQQTTVEQGALIIADGEEAAGGQVVLWSDGETFFDGEISAKALGSFGNGGFVEVSGRQSLQIGDNAKVSTASANGNDGTLLIDPVNVTISAVGGGGTMTDVFVRNSVESGNFIIHTNGGNPGDTGSINIFSGAKIIYSSRNSLTLLSSGDIFVDGDIKNIGTVDTTLRSANLNDINGTGHINLVAGWSGTLPVVLNDNIDSSYFLNGDGTPRFNGAFGAWGAPGSRIYFNESGFEAVEVGSARGETNVFADVIQLRHGRADGRFTQIGYRRVADTRDIWDGGTNNNGFGGYFANPNDQIVDGDINVYGLSNVFMRPSDETSIADGNKVRLRVYTQIGHGGIRRADDSVDNVGGTAHGYDSGVIVVDDGNNSGDITVFAGRNLAMQGPKYQGHTQIGHGGHAAAVPTNGNFRPGLQLTVIGDMTGDINVTAGTISMEAGLYNDVPVQIGHGGLNIRGEFSGDISVTSTIAGITGTAAPNLTMNGQTANVLGDWSSNRNNSYVQIGHGGVGSYHNSALPARFLPIGAVGGSTSYAGDGININPLTGLPYGHNGDITVRAKTGIQMTATGDVAYAMVGHGGSGSHGDHRGNISVVAEAGNVIFDRIAPQIDLNGLDRRNVGAGAFVQIGHGGRRSSGGNTGDIEVSATGNIEFYAGRSEAHAQIGHGGRGIVDVITVGATGSPATGGVANQRNTAYANGTHSGDIRVTAGGNIKFRGGFGTGGTAFAMIGNGGYRQYSDTLTISTTVAGVSGTPVGGGAGQYLLVDGNTGLPIVLDSNGVPVTYDPLNPAESPFLLDSGGSPVITNGVRTLNPEFNFGTLSYSRYNGEAAPFAFFADPAQQGHNGDITINAGGNIDFQAGQTEALRGQEPFGIEMNRTQNFVMIGNGGDESWGDMWGNININGGGNLVFEGRGGWDAITYEGNDYGPYDPTTATPAGRGVPRLGSNEDNGGNGVRNFAMIGNGGYAAGGRIVNGQPAHRDGTGSISRGQGVYGSSDITIDVDGDVIMRAAQLEDVGPSLVTRAILSKRNITGGTQIVYTDIYGNPVTLSATVGAHNWSPDIVNRIAPNIEGAPGGNPGLGDPLGALGETLGRATFNDITGFRLSNDGTAANQNRFIMADGVNFAGNEIVYLEGSALGSALGGTGTVLSGTQAYQVINVRANEQDFQLRPVTLGAGGGVFGGVVVIGTSAPSIGTLQIARETWNGWKAATPVPGAQVTFTQIGNGGYATSLSATPGVTADPGVTQALNGEGHRGNITINAGGGVIIEASDFETAVGTGQTLLIDRVAYDGTQLLDAMGVPLFDIMVGPAFPNLAPPGLNHSVGTNFTAVATSASGAIPDTIRAQQEHGMRLRNYAQVGNGGWTARGDHQGNITIVAGQTAAGVGLRLAAGEGREDYAQIGNGGYDADGFDPLGTLSANDNGRLNDIGSSGDISITVVGDIQVLGGGQNNKVGGRTGTTTDSSAANVVPPAGSAANAAGSLVANDDTRFSYAQIGNGGADNGGTHSGNISLISTAGGLDLIVGNNTRYPYVHIGNGGMQARGQAHSGDIYVRVFGDINILGSKTYVDDNSYFEDNDISLVGGIPSTGSSRLQMVGTASGSTIRVANSSGLYVGQSVSDSNGNLIGTITAITITSSPTAKPTYDVSVSAAPTAGQALFNFGAVGTATVATDASVATGATVVNFATARPELFIGQSISGTGIAAGTRITDISADGLTVTLSAATTAPITAFNVGHNGQIGHQQIAYVQIGNGGWDSDPQAGNLNLQRGVGNFSGNIDVISTGGDINIQAGGDPLFSRSDGDTFFRGLSAHIGHGGNFTDGDANGNINVVAAGDLDIKGGAGSRDGFTMIGHGGHQVDGNLAGNIDIIAGNNFTMNRGADSDSSPVGSTNRAGTELFNNWVKVGHGDARQLNQRTDGLGTRNGDIHISVGQTMNLGDPANRPFLDPRAYTRLLSDRVLIGHIDSRIGLSDPFRSTVGNTYIAVSRDFPYEQGLGEFITNTGTVITSSREGLGSELRIYMPKANNNNRIAEGTYFNDTQYTNTPAPGSGARDDEQIATGHFFTTGASGELVADFERTPLGVEGAYPPNSFGLYNIYYAELSPVIPPTPITPPDTDQFSYEANFRSMGLFQFDGYDDMLLSMALADGLENDRDPAAGATMVEEWLDGHLGSRRNGRATVTGEMLEDEEDEELLRRKRIAQRKVGKSGFSYYVFDPATNRYSSYRVFGVPQTSVPVMGGGAPATEAAKPGPTPKESNYRVPVTL